MPSSGIIDLAIGMAFVFGVTAALACVVTGLIARFLGLRGEYLLVVCVSSSTAAKRKRSWATQKRTTRP